LANLGLIHGEPVTVQEIHKLAQELTFDLPEALMRLYLITDGMFIGDAFRISGLRNATPYYSKLFSINARFLGLPRFWCNESAQELGIMRD
jgi:hypothetical protein